MDHRSRRWMLGLVVLFALGTMVPIATAPPARAADSWESLGSAVGTIAPRVSFLVAEAYLGECYPVFEVDPAQRVAIASTFKLYVLGELARQVASGLADWDEQLAVTSRWKSKPAGGMLYEPEGIEHTLRHFAERMIADSDNTATDHLIARLGRQNVEAAQTLLGHGEPALNTPLLMTREFFAFKIAADDDFVATYVAASDDEQRRILEARVTPVRLAPEGWGSWNGPRWIDAIEWFASADDLCRALARLHQMSSQPELEPVAEIMALNRGGTIFDRETWPYAAFKEGYEAGVYNLTWLVRRSDGRHFVISAGFNDPDRFIDRAAAWALIERAEALLAEFE